MPDFEIQRRKEEEANKVKPPDFKDYSYSSFSFIY
jgi:hypothetical protein